MERLEAQLEELEILYRYIPVGLCVVDRDLRYVKTNQIYAEVVGREIHEVVGHTMHEVVAERVREQTTSLARRVIDTGEPVLDVEVRSRFRANVAEERIWLVSVHPVHSGDCVTGSLAVMFDVTARKQLEEKTERLWQRQRLESLGVLAGVKKPNRIDTTAKNPTVQPLNAATLAAPRNEAARSFASCSSCCCSGVRGEAESAISGRTRPSPPCPAGDYLLIWRSQPSGSSTW